VQRADQPLQCGIRCRLQDGTGKNVPPPLWAVAARSRKAFMSRLQLRTDLAGDLPATSLADGAAFILDSMGSSSPDAEAKTANTAARLAKLHTSAKTALATRALKELSLNVDDCMMFSMGVAHTVVEESSAKATPCYRRLHRARSCDGMLRTGSMPAAMLDLPAAHRKWNEARNLSVSGPRRALARGGAVV